MLHAGAHKSGNQLTSAMIQNGFAPESKEIKIKRMLSVRNKTDPSDLFKHSWKGCGCVGWMGSNLDVTLQVHTSLGTSSQAP